MCSTSSRFMCSGAAARIEKLAKPIGPAARAKVQMYLLAYLSTYLLRLLLLLPLLMLHKCMNARAREKREGRNEHVYIHVRTSKGPCLLAEQPVAVGARADAGSLLSSD